MEGEPLETPIGLGKTPAHDPELKARDQPYAEFRLREGEWTFNLVKRVKKDDKTIGYIDVFKTEIRPKKTTKATRRLISERMDKLMKGIGGILARIKETREEEKETRGERERTNKTIDILKDIIGGGLAPLG